MRLVRSVWLVIVLLSPPASAIDVDNPPKGVFADDWYAIMIDGHKSGHMHSVTERRGDTILSRMTMLMMAGRDTARVTVTVTQENEESVAGEPLSFSNTMKLGKMPSTTRGRIKDGKVTITTSQFGIPASMSTYDLPAGAKMSWAVYREQMKRGLKPGTKYDISVYEPTMSADKLTPATIEILDKEKIDLFGRMVEAIKTRETMKIKALLGAEMAVETVTWMEEDGTPVKLQMSMMNIPIELIACTKAVAMAENDPAELMAGTLVRVNPPPDPTASQIRYRIRFRTSGQNEMPRLPETGLQKVESQGKDEVVLVVSRRHARTKSPSKPLTDEERKLYLAASPLVNYKDPEVAKLAREAAGDEKDPRKLADRFRRFVGDYIHDKTLGVGFGSASEVARSKEGDCTEHGVLLAALGRAAGIPTRIVTGIVYADEFAGRAGVFVGHLWTQFHLDGEWVDLDAALHQTDVEPTHIALDVNAAADTGVAELVGSLWLTMGNLEIQVLEGAESRPASSRASQ